MTISSCPRLRTYWCGLRLRDLLQSIESLGFLILHRTCFIQTDSYYSTHIRSRLSSDGTGAGPSSTGANLPDELFTRVIDAMSEKLATNLRFRWSAMPSRERLYILAQEVAAASTPDSQVMSAEFFSLFRQEIITMLITVVEDVFRPILTQTQVI